MAAVAVVFVLFTVLAQVSAAFLAHRIAGAAVGAAAARTAVSPESRGIEADRLRSELERVVPGARIVAADIEVVGITVRAGAVFEFVPPGPLLHPIEMEVRADAPLAIEP